MRTITRKVNQTTIIGDDVKISIGEIYANGNIKLCITAPRDVHILRHNAKKKTKTLMLDKAV